MRQVFPIILSVFLLTGCAPLIVGAGITTGHFSFQERGLKQSAEDITLKVKIHERIGRLNDEYLKDINISVVEQNVLITGVVTNREEIIQIGHAIKSIKGVGKVFNNLQLKPYTFKQYTNDKTIGTNLRTRLIFTKNVYTINYDISIVKGHVYIIGLALNEDEIKTMLHKVSTSKGVIKVHNYVQVAPEGASIRQKMQKRAPSEDYGIKEAY